MSGSRSTSAAPGANAPAMIAHAVPAPRAGDDLESRRLTALHSLAVLDTPSEAAFDDLVSLASHIAGVPTALVSLVDAERQWFKARVGLDICTTGRDVAFCDHVVRNQAEVEVPDTRLDLRFRTNPLVIGAPYVVFYAGFPLVMPDGLIVGTLCVIGYEPKRLDEVVKRHLRALAEQVVTQLVMRRTNVEQAQEIERRRQVEKQLAASRREFRFLAEYSSDVICRISAEGVFTYVSPSLLTVLGADPAAAIGNTADDSVFEDDRSAFAAARAAALGGETTTITVRVQHADTTWRSLEVTLAPVPGIDGGLEIHTASRDVTERVRAAAELADSEANLAAIGRVVRRIRTGEDARETIVNAARDVAGTDYACLIEAAEDGEGLVVTASTGTPEAGFRISFEESATVHAWRTGRQLFVPDETTHPLINTRLLSAVGVRSLLWQPILLRDEVTAILFVGWNEQFDDLSARAARAVVLLADETAVALEHDALLQRYAELAVTDSLTGLPNRRAWNERIHQLVAEAARSGRPLVVAVADVDRFKAFNDTHGHLGGDVLLQQIAVCMQAELREIDVVARWGGEEFAVALPGCDAAQAVPVLERLLTSLPQEQTMSIGFVELTPGSSVHDLMVAADKALYAAKHGGRNRMVVAPPPTPPGPPVR